MSIGEYLKSVFSLEGKTILISGATGGIGECDQPRTRGGGR